jgi:polyisoprenoid-binding protein YceI
VTRFRVVPGSSTVETEMRSSLHPIHAASGQLSGVIEGVLGADGKPDLQAPHGARLELPVESIRSGNRLQDMEMQRRMEARRWPAIRVTVRRVWPLDDTGRCRAQVEVGAHGRSREVEGEFSLRIDGGRATVEGEHVFDVRDFGLSPPRFLAFKVEPDVRVRVRVVAEEEAG